MKYLYYFLSYFDFKNYKKYENPKNTFLAFYLLKSSNFFLKIFPGLLPYSQHVTNVSFHHFPPLCTLTRLAPAEYQQQSFFRPFAAAVAVAAARTTPGSIPTTLVFLLRVDRSHPSIHTPTQTHFSLLLRLGSYHSHTSFSCVSGRTEIQV